MTPFEKSLFEEKLLKTAILSDEATYYEISLFAKEALCFLKRKNIEVTEIQAYALLISTLLYRGSYHIDTIFRRSIANRKTLNRKKMIEKRIKKNSVFALDPAELEPDSLQEQEPAHEPDNKPEASFL